MTLIVVPHRAIEAGGGGAIAQLGERIVRNDEVGGSIPPGSTSLRRRHVFIRIFVLAGLIQVKARVLVKATRLSADTTPELFRF
jgi:hypothetical protein